MSANGCSRNAAACHARRSGEPDAGIHLAVAEHGERVPAAAAQVGLAPVFSLDPHPQRSVVVDDDADLVSHRPARPHDLRHLIRVDQEFRFVVDSPAPLLHRQEMIGTDAKAADELCRFGDLIEVVAVDRRRDRHVEAMLDDPAYPRNRLREAPRTADLVVRIGRRTVEADLEGNLAAPQAFLEAVDHLVAKEHAVGSTPRDRSRR